MNFVNAVNAVNGRAWIAVIILLAMALLFVRYCRIAPKGSIIDSLNSTHVAVFGFVLCLCGIGLTLSGHAEAGDKVFLSGASFIGGIAASRAIKANDSEPPQKS